MSVPAFKNSRSKVRRRRSHHALKPIQLVKDKTTGELVLPHHVKDEVAVQAAPKAEKETPKAKTEEAMEAKKAPASKKK